MRSGSGSSDEPEKKEEESSESSKTCFARKQTIKADHLILCRSFLVSGEKEQLIFTVASAPTQNSFAFFVAFHRRLFPNPIPALNLINQARAQLRRAPSVILPDKIRYMFALRTRTLARPSTEG